MPQRNLQPKTLLASAATRAGAVHTAASFTAPVILSPRAQLDPIPVSEQQEN
ncbi:hypothetical protein QR685DRAFT_551102 [Neurospora intermedia]|uniref:Uncharacterized protein n=1 Tax=Neurospora intermedia TaxID=5142 RepID=A0ABR3DKM0_NEUIN